jgi:hypothetical protein
MVEIEVWKFAFILINAFIAGITLGRLLKPTVTTSSECCDVIAKNDTGWRKDKKVTVLYNDSKPKNVTCPLIKGKTCSFTNERCNFIGNASLKLRL